MMINWLELIEIAKTISFTDENDQLIWQYETNVIYSSSSMYALVNFRGIQPIPAFCVETENSTQNPGVFVVVFSK
jgi:hypothetical protein